MSAFQAFDEGSRVRVTRSSPSTFLPPKGALATVVPAHMPGHWVAVTTDNGEQHLMRPWGLEPAGRTAGAR